MKLYKAIRSGTARNGAERDRGHVVHLTTDNAYPSWSKAICGIRPKGNGWYYPDQLLKVTCDKCIQKELNKNKNEQKSNYRCSTNNS